MHWIGLKALSWLSGIPLLRKLTWMSRYDVLFAFNFPMWKRAYVERCFSGERIVYLPAKGDIVTHRYLIESAKSARFLVWGYRQPDGLESYATSRGIQVQRMEDGFIRSIGLGSKHILPMSICVDGSALYYDARSPSDLEKLLQTHDFEADPALMHEAHACMSYIQSHRLTKYNLPETQFASTLYGLKNRPRILVLGQVEDDQSVKFGCDRPVTNNEVVRLAARENPGAQIIYKVHPDVLAGMRPGLSNPREVADIALIIDRHMSLDDALSGVDRVYTISSLAGFESLIRGIPVTTIGCPFYAGWGVTDDRQPNPRRTRRLNVKEIFAGAYLLYAKYYDPMSGRTISLNDVMSELSTRMAESVRAN